MHKDFRFNTGRLYGPRGQVIWVRFDDVARTITFADLSRGIDGKFPCKQWNPSEHYVRETVMACYDRMAYSSDRDTLQFLNNEANKLETAFQEVARLEAEQEKSQADREKGLNEILDSKGKP